MRKSLSTRRVFLQKGLTLLAAAPTVPAFLEQTVWALNDPLDAKNTQQDSGKDGKILVVVQLSGGNDGLSTIVPYGDDIYNRLRPGLAIPKKEILRIDDYLGLNPNLKGLYGMLDNQQLCIIQGVGYPNPNRSHFRSMDIWHSAHPEKEFTTSGWIGRYFDNACDGADPHVGVSIGDTMPLSMQGDKLTPLSFERPDTYQYKGNDRDRYLELNKAEKAEMNGADVVKPAMRSGAAKRQAAPALTAANQLDFLERTAMDAQVSSDDILRMTREHQPSVEYPGNEFGNGLKTIAAMIAGGLSTRVYYVSLGGFDTHAGQRGRHDQLMQQFSEGVSAFWKDMESQKNDQRVLMLSFSEFGRRVQQNASNGTDHGAAAPMFLMGPAIRKNNFGKHPSLADLDQGDLKYNVDFRSVYATVLEEWLETQSKPILGQSFKTLPILKT